MMYHNDSGDSIIIRTSQPEDEDALHRLAGRDSAPLPGGQLLVAFVGDQLRAAIPVAGGAAIADPFHPTADLVRVLGTRAEQMRRNGGDRSSWFRRLHTARRRRPARAAA